MMNGQNASSLYTSIKKNSKSTSGCFNADMKKREEKEGSACQSTD
jgi:hypothetical protein